MERPLLEVIVQTLTDAREAARGGADRLEVVRSLADGGLTPPLALVQEIAAHVSLPLRVMIRENAGYTTHAGELAALREAAAAFANANVDGVVIGFAHAGELELDKVAQVLTTAPDVNVTFHRAFDQLRDPLAAIDALAAVARIDRILTSGGEGPPAVRAERLRAYQERAGYTPHDHRWRWRRRGDAGCARPHPVGAGSARRARRVRRWRRCVGRAGRAAQSPHRAARVIRASRAGRRDIVWGWLRLRKRLLVCLRLPWKPASKQEV